MTKHFEGNNFIGRVLRFLNVVEPDGPGLILSISRLMAWLAFGSFVWVIINKPDNVVALLTTLLSTLAAGGHYAYRRVNKQ